MVRVNIKKLSKRFHVVTIVSPPSFPLSICFLLSIMRKHFCSICQFDLLGAFQGLITYKTFKVILYYHYVVWITAVYLFLLQDKGNESSLITPPPQSYSNTTFYRLPGDKQSVHIPGKWTMSSLRSPGLPWIPTCIHSNTKSQDVLTLFLN